MSLTNPARKKLGAPYFLVGFIGYFCLITLGSHIPGETIAKMGFDFWDKAIHAFEYLPLGLLAAPAMSRRPLNFDRLTVMLAGPLLLVVLGVIDEFHQSFVPGRFCSSADAAADALGGVAGFFVGKLADERRLGVKTK